MMLLEEPRPKERLVSVEDHFAATTVWHIYKIEHEQRRVLGHTDTHVCILLPHGMAARLTVRQKVKLRERVLRRDWVSTVADTTVLSAGVASTVEAAWSGEFGKVSILIVLLASILFVVRMAK